MWYDDVDAPYWHIKKHNVIIRDERRRARLVHTSISMCFLHDGNRTW
jgi:hypothetical protein